MLIAQISAEWQHIAVWALMATVTMTTVLHGSTGIGLTRLSLPFLIGTMLTGNRSRASIAGFVIYLIGGWAFALVYFLIMFAIGTVSWWLGALIGLVHALFLLVVVLPLLPYVHPRMATEYDGPGTMYRLEPPGFMGMNYGYRTPLTTVAGQVLYGLILGAAF
jgi:hypothetical protein